MSENSHFEIFNGVLCVAGRGLLGWSQTDLAQRANVARKTISEFEGGRRPLNLRTRKTLAEAMIAEGLMFRQEAGRILVSVPISVVSTSIEES